MSTGINCANSSPAGAEGSGWPVNRELEDVLASVPGSTARERLYRPDIVKELTLLVSEELK